MQQCSSSTNTIKLPEKHPNTTGTTKQTRKATDDRTTKTNHENRSKNKTVTKQTTITEAKQIETETSTIEGSRKQNNNFRHETG
ncbi:hypothetical protein QL285_025588 [Trifolium repens]|nr:hypothetical protein QL285_025588 [Trifolium repens]